MYDLREFPLYIRANTQIRMRMWNASLPVVCVRMRVCACVCVYVCACVLINQWGAFNLLSVRRAEACLVLS